MRRSKSYYIRKAHRYLGLFLGVQFLLWTIGGLYFSWNDIDKVHGDHLRKEKKYLPASLSLVSPEQVLQELQKTHLVDSLHSVQLIEVTGVPVYQIRFFSGTKDPEPEPTHGGHGETQPAGAKIVNQLAYAQTGNLRAPLTEDEALLVARQTVVEPAVVEKVEYLTEVGGHHEYRGKPLPAWAVSFKEPTSCTVYLAAELGTFQSIRHNQWRAFDFLWMLHTMDYSGRDNFGNVLLKLFSVLGLVTVFSGFALYFVSSSSLRKLRKKI